MTVTTAGAFSSGYPPSFFLDSGNPWLDTVGSQSGHIQRLALGHNLGSAFWIESLCNHTHLQKKKKIRCFRSFKVSYSDTWSRLKQLILSQMSRVPLRWTRNVRRRIFQKFPSSVSSALTLVSTFSSTDEAKTKERIDSVWIIASFLTQTAAKI